MKQVWDRLLKDDTYQGRSNALPFDKRDPFENDYGRLISSSAIRRLQDKTQVFPLEKSDFIRTRLTHSLEVSSIARSIGKSVERTLIEKGRLDIEKLGYISSLLSTAGLVHDLGNPPFGHFGEEAIKSFFKEYFNTDNRGLKNQELQDLQNFDGNVQTFRILRRLHLFKTDGFSYNLTFPTLASVIKYPRTSIEGNKGDSASNIAEKKFGYFLSEEEEYLKLNAALGLNNKRHPIVYLLEAADDIAFAAADIEDGVKLGILSFDEIEQVFQNELKESSDLNNRVLSKLKDYHNELSTLPSDNRLDLTIQRFRVATQGEMINAVVGEFMNSYDSIISGDYNYEILNRSEAKDVRRAYKKLTKKVFNSKSVLETELAGWKVIKGLLEEFIPASEQTGFEATGNTKERRLYNMISSNYRYIYEKHSSNYKGSEKYKRYQLVLDFISGMTDSYALDTYQKISGIKL